MEGLTGVELAWLGWAVSRDDNEWEKEVRGERSYGEYEKGPGADTGGGFPGFINLVGGEVGVC